MQGRKPKFNLGDRAIGEESGPASFRGRAGTIVERGPGKSEYGVKFDDGPTEYVDSSWIERLDGRSEFENGDSVRKIGSQEVLTIVETRLLEDLYMVQSGNDAASRQYLKGSELELVAKARRPDSGPAFVPKRSIME